MLACWLFNLFLDILVLSLYSDIVSLLIDAENGQGLGDGLRLDRRVHSFTSLLIGESGAFVQI